MKARSQIFKCSAHEYFEIKVNENFHFASYNPKGPSRTIDFLGSKIRLFNCIMVYAPITA
jgi:hypothetical protein